jgi:antitoxin component YwqK of YwqJK toxin-antitoxin module
MGLLAGMGCGSLGGGRFQPPWRMGSDGLLYHPTTGALYTGEFDHTIDGERHKGSIANGQQDGQFAIWYASGVKKVEWTYVAGQRHGRVQSWFDGGRPRTDLTFNHGLLLNGTTFRPDGTEASRMANGTGTLRAYHGNGNLHWEKTYQDGRRVGQKIYHPDGNLKVGAPPKGSG